MNKMMIAAASLVALAGCASEQVVSDERAGATVRAALALQYAPAPRGAPVPGMDGVAAKASIDRYEKAAQAPAPVPNVLTIGVGSGAAQR
ncbi:MAG: hypothetical protein V4582_21175 [Pseudomonadota bacterium]